MEERGGTRQSRTFTAQGGQIVNPAIAILALGFLLLIGAMLIAGGFGFHFLKGYIYPALAFSGAVEGLDMLPRRRRKRPPKRNGRGRQPHLDGRRRGHLRNPPAGR